MISNSNTRHLINTKILDFLDKPGKIQHRRFYDQWLINVSLRSKYLKIVMARRNKQTLGIMCVDQITAKASFRF